MMAKQYKERGGEYNEPKSKGQDKSGQNLENWGKEEWQTKEGKGEAKQKDGSRKRYLPKKAWEAMSENEKQETDDKKQEEGQDKQHVGNTGRAKRARKNAQEPSKDAEVQQEKEEPKANTSKKRGRAKMEEPEENEDADEAEGVEDEEKATPAKKQKTGSRAKNNSPKDGKGKTVGSKHMKSDAPAQQASLKRLPKKGQQAHWKAMPGWVDGEVVEVVKSGKKVDGKQVKASMDDPKIVLKSNSSGKICVHKVDNVYFD